MATYSFLDVSASIVGPGGAIALGSGSGAAEEGISVEYTTEADTLTIGADGTPMHGLNADKSGTITVRLLKTSPTNQQLMAMFNVQRASSSLFGNNVITIIATHGGDVTTAQSVAFKQKAGLTYAKDAGMNEWAFSCGKIDSALGGDY